jgi:hypothetical protein
MIKACVLASFIDEREMVLSPATEVAFGPGMGKHALRADSTPVLRDGHEAAKMLANGADKTVSRNPRRENCVHTMATRRTIEPRFRPAV